MLSSAFHFRGDIIKKYKIISLILSLSVLMSVVIFPFQSFAYDDWVTNKSINHFSFCVDSGACYIPWLKDMVDGYYNIPKVFESQFSTTEKNLKNIQLGFDIYKANELHDGDTLELQLYVNANSRYLSFESVEALFDGSSHVKGTYTWDRAKGLLSAKFICNNDTKAGEKVGLYLNNPTCNGSYDNFYMKVEKIRTRSISKQDSERTTFFDNVKNWFNTVFEWLKSIRDNLSNGFSNIGSWLTNLGDRISNFFTTLSNNIKGFFTDLGNNIKTWFDNLVKDLKNLNAKIGQWFKDLTSSIGDFFTKLFNRLWWGNEDGEAAYQPPTINNKLNDILAILNDYRDKLNDTITNIDSSAVAVSDYLSNGTALVNGVINVAGAGFTALITFGIVFVLVRKVVGR